MPELKISDVAQTVGGILNEIPNGAMVPVAVPDGAGGYLNQNRVVNLKAILDLIGPELTEAISDWATAEIAAHIAAYISANSVPNPIGTALAFMDPANVTSAYMAPQTWQDLAAEATLTPVAGALTFDPKAGTIGGVTVGALSFITTLTAATTVSFTKASMVPGALYRLHAKASGGARTITFTGAARTFGGISGGVSIASGKGRDFLIRMEGAGGDVLVIPGAVQD